MGSILIILYQLLLQILFFHRAYSLVGYDCSKANINVTTFSLLDSPTCGSQKFKTVNETQFIQLVSVRELDYIHVFECRVRLWRHVQVFPTGQWLMSHAVTPEHGEASFNIDLTKNHCLDLHRTRAFSYGFKFQINDLKLNATSQYDVQLAGVWKDTSCKTESYVDRLGTFSDACVSGRFEISLLDYTAKVDLKTNAVELISGQFCNVQDLNCLSVTGHNVYWDYIRKKDCRKDQFSAIYTGKATLYYEKDLSNNVIKRTIIVKTDKIAFSLALRSNIELCGLSVYTTDHPKFKVFTYDNGHPAFPDDEKALDINLFTYMNIKFTTFDHHLNEELTSLYNFWKQEECREGRVLHSLLRSVAVSSPDMFSFLMSGKPGYMTVVKGEIAYVGKCVPITVKLRHTKRCWTDVPVFWDEKSYFITPFNHILRKSSIEISCTNSTPFGYMFGGAWVNPFDEPSLSRPETIDVLQLNSRDWYFHEDASLLTKGIYTLPTIDDFSHQINHLPYSQTNIPTESLRLEQVAVVSSVNRATINDESMGLIKEFYKLFGWWKWFGDNVSALLGSYLLYRILIIILRWILNCRRLYKKNGFSLKLFKSISSNATIFSLMKQQINSIKENEEMLVPMENLTSPSNVETHSQLPGVYPPSYSQLLIQSSNPVRSAYHEQKLELRA